MNKIWNSSNRKVFYCNLFTALALNLFLEYMERKSLAELVRFINDRTFVFLFNMLIIFVTLSVVFIARKKLFTWAAVTGAWTMVGLANGFILTTRKTPFTAVDIMLTRSILPVLDSYLKPWQIAGIVVLIIIVVIVMVCLYIYSPVARKSFDFKVNMSLFLLQLIVFAGITYMAAGKDLLIRRFDNLIAGYKDYGVAYGFCVTALDTGIDRPLDYSSDKIHRIETKINKKIKKIEKEANKSGEEGVRTPNIIFIQLESFFDISTVKKLQVSQDPIPNFHRIQEESSSGFLTVPVYGAGTINTEFEVITGMRTAYFGTGEYPYRSILQNHTCDSIAYWLADLPYEKSVIHNNNASFYDRDHVLTNLGFDHFLTIENMNAGQPNAAGWTRDSILTKEILSTLNETADRDLIYTISVQGHGDYPEDPMPDAPVQVTGKDLDQSYLNQLTYYASQTQEMDLFIGELIDQLKDYPEDTVVVAYGDHLPGMDFKDKDLTCGSKYKTPYFIWDNFGYNEKNRDKESADLAAWQLASRVMSQQRIRQGTLNRFHQAMKDGKNYKKNLRLLQYDMLYGADFISKEEGILREQTAMNFCLHKILLKKAILGKERNLLYGSFFTPESRVYVNGRAVKTKYLYPYLLEIPSKSIKDGDKVVIHQVSQTNEKITLNRSGIFVVRTGSL